MTLTHGEPQVDRDPAETAEWLEALDAVVRNDGDDRARELLEALFADARRRGLHPAEDLSTPYVNTIPTELEAQIPGDPTLEHQVRSLVRWNAIATVLRANKESSELGGHIASLPVRGDALRGRLQPLLARADRGARGRPRLHPGPLLAGHLRARLPRGAAQRGAAEAASARRSAAAGSRPTRTRG